MSNFDALVAKVRQNDADRRAYVEACTNFVVALATEMRTQVAAVGGQVRFDLKDIEQIQGGVMSVPMRFAMPEGNTIYNGQRKYLDSEIKIQTLDLEKSVYFIALDHFQGRMITSADQGVAYLSEALGALDDSYTKAFLEQ